MEPPPSPSEALALDAEDPLIARILAARPAPTPSQARVRVDAGDDAAVLADGTAVTVDAMVEGVHWDERLSPADVGWKLLAVSVSDLAAMGAAPGWAVLTLALPNHDEGWLTAFMQGLAEALAAWSVRLVGGDLVRTPGARMASLTLGGTCVAAPITRAGGLPGDDLWVTGTLGLAGLGWRSAEPPEVALEALRRPTPPLAFALDLARADLVHAAMDLSDGLARDLPRLARASHCGAIVSPSSLPGHEALGEQGWVHQVSGGEDYQLLFAAPPSASAALMALAHRHGVRLTRIGELETGTEVRLSDRAWPPPAFQHFPVSA